MANIIMKYQEQFVNFPGKQGLPIKSKQHIELSDIISCQLPGGRGNLFSFWRQGGNNLHLQIIEIISPQSISRVFFFCIL